MLLLGINREQILEIMPKGQVMAEIGELDQDLSNIINGICEPETFHVINSGAPASITVEEGPFKVHNSRLQALEDLEDGSLDWAFVGGNISFDAVLADLRLCAKKLKKGGIILGQGYSNHQLAKVHGCEVIPAVKTFMKETGYQLQVLTMEGYPTYILSQGREIEEDSFLVELFVKFLEVSPMVLQLKDFEQINYQQYVTRVPNGELRTVVDISA